MNTPTITEDGISLLEITRKIWAGRKIVATTVALCLVLGVVYLHIAPRLYNVTMSIAPVRQNASDQAPSALSGIKSLLGGSADADQISYTLFLDALQSNKIASETLLKKPDILHVIFASEWDAKRQQWVKPFSALHEVSSSIKSLLGITVVPWSPPNLSRVSRYLDSIKISSNPLDPVTEVSIEVADPQFGKYLLFSIVNILDDHMKKETKERADVYIENIQRQLKTTSTLEVRESLIELLTQQQKTRIEASSTLTYVVDIFGPIIASDAPTSPSAPIILALALVIGLVAGSLIVLVFGRTVIRRLMDIGRPPVT